MATPRKDVFDPHVVGMYHCVTRCVRQLFLLGRDKKARLENAGRWNYCELRLQNLAGIFAIDVLDFAMLSNHIHTSLRNRPDVVKAWSDHEVARRWLKLHPTEAKKKKEKLKEITEQDIDNAAADPKLMTKARRKLSCISHFQKTFLEPIAKEFNRRDGKKGHFVAERFRCKRLDQEGALLACSIYIALNPFRAGLGDTIQAHPHSSYSRRHRRVLSQAEKDAVVVPEHIAKILESLGIDAKYWLDTIDRYAELFHNFVASPSQLDEIARKLDKKYVKGVRACRTLFLAAEDASTDLPG